MLRRPSSVCDKATEAKITQFPLSQFDCELRRAPRLGPGEGAQTRVGDFRLRGAISLKWFKLEPRSPLITYRKSYMDFQCMQKSMTFSDL